MNDLDLIFAKEQGDLIRRAISIIEELSKSRVCDEDGEETSKELEYKNIALKARYLTTDPYWEMLHD